MAWSLDQDRDTHTHIQTFWALFPGICPVRCLFFWKQSGSSRRLVTGQCRASTLGFLCSVAFSSTFHLDGYYSSLPELSALSDYICERSWEAEGLDWCIVLTPTPVPGPAVSGVCWLRRGSGAGKVTLVKEHWPLLQVTRIWFSVATRQLTTVYNSSFRKSDALF